MVPLRQFVEEDAYRYAGAYGRAALMRAATIPGFRFTVCLRRCADARALGLRGFPELALVRPYYEHLRVKYGFDIPYVTSIGPGFYLGHFGGVVISGDAQIGACVNVSHGVTIGRVNGGRKKGAPIIGERVWIGPNAVVVGKCVVGADARIAPGAFVDFDVPERAVVLGNPAKVVSVGGTGHYVNRIPPRLFRNQDKREVLPSDKP